MKSEILPHRLFLRLIKPHCTMTVIIKLEYIFKKTQFDSQINVLPTQKKKKQHQQTSL